MGYNKICSRSSLPELSAAMTWPCGYDLANWIWTCDQKWSNSWRPVTEAHETATAMLYYSGGHGQWPWCPWSVSSSHADSPSSSKQCYNLFSLQNAAGFSPFQVCEFLYFVCIREVFPTPFLIPRISKTLEPRPHFNPSSFQRCGFGQIADSRK